MRQGQVKEDINIPVWQKVAMTIEEAAEYSSIGINLLRELVNEPTCDFAICIGKRKLVKRKEFEQYISDSYIIR